MRPTEVERRGAVVLTDRRTTLADCLGRLPDREAWSLLAWVITRELATADDLEAQIADRFHLYGVVRLRCMVAAVRDGALSLGEVAFHEFLRSHGFDDWLGDQKVGAHGRILARADVLAPELGIVFEFDGLIAHDESTEAADAERELRLTKDLGLVVERVTWADIFERPRATRDRLRGAIADAAARSASGERPAPVLVKSPSGVWHRRRGL